MNVPVNLIGPEKWTAEKRILLSVIVADPEQFFANVKRQFMEHTEDHGARVIYTNDIAVFLNTAISFVV